MKAKLTNLGTVMVGDKFVFRTADVLGPNARKLPFEGQVLTVTELRPPRYVNRVVVKDQDGAESLFRLDTVEKALGSQSIQPQ